MSIANPWTKSKKGSYTANALTTVKGIGRFAPSPTGPLHLGSLYTAVASYVDAHARDEAWWVRIDDLDTPRNVSQSESRILRTLEAHHLRWDGAVQRQSEHMADYQRALATLDARELLYFCTCSRRQLKTLPRYPGTCRDQSDPIVDAAIRVLTDDHVYRFEDLVVGKQSTRVDLTTGDFIVKRRDGIVAYQLATAYDDGQPGITRVIRGTDLLSNTSRQLHLMRLLELTPPSYAHLPVVLNAAGDKLSKQTKAAPVDDSKALANLRTCMELLALHPPKDCFDLDELLEWAIQHWDLGRIGTEDHLPAA